MALNRIRELIQGKVSYIVPGVPCKEDILIAINLKIPIYSGDYEKYTKLLENISII